MKERDLKVYKVMTIIGLILIIICLKIHNNTGNTIFLGIAIACTCMSGTLLGVLLNFYLRATKIIKYYKDGSKEVSYVIKEHGDNEEANK